MSFPASRSDDRDRVGPYVLVKAIGAGGSARIDLARIERAYGFQRHVVIKRPLEHLRGDPRAAESIRREARLGARLRHPHLIAILDAGVHDGYPYLCLEYVHGGSLRTLMQADEGPRVRDVSLEVALAIVRDVARGVHEAHELHDEHGAPLGLVHRDVSPGNILLGLDGAVKLADFGIAKETRVATLSGSMHGTVTYMAPEQCRGHAFDRRADVFSLGVILYELVTGTRLFWADNDVASLHRVLAGTVIRPRKVRATIAPDLEDIIMTAVAAEQDKRFATARALADAIETYATAAGQILAARCVSRWTHEILGPRDNPWIGNETVVDTPLVFPEPEPEPPQRVSLVSIIEATPIYDEEPLLPTFGPNDAGVIEDTPPPLPPLIDAPAPPRKRRAVVAGLLGAALAGGIIAVVVTSKDHAPAPAQPAAAPVTDTPPPVVEPEEPAGVAAPTAGSETEPAAETEDEVADEIELEPAEPESTPTATASTSPTKSLKRKKKRRRHVTTTTKPATPGTPKVEWNPTMVLPTDQKK